MSSVSDDMKVVIIGGGPAGLTAAYELSKAKVSCVVLEKDLVLGGLARTVCHQGYLFDIGGHRFFTKVKAAERMWQDVLGEDFIRCRRLSRIYYNKRFFHYPLRLLDTLLGLGFWNSALILWSYLWAQLFPAQHEETFEDWICNRFGRRLYRTFFKTYTEKVWGIPCSEIKAEWAAQRIKGLSLFEAVKHALLRPATGGTDGVIKTLIDAFHYPKKGPGMMWNAVAALVEKEGNAIRLGANVERVNWTGARVSSIRARLNDHADTVHGSHFLSSMPIQELIGKFSPPAPASVLKAAEGLSYRDFITVALILNKRDLFPDNWIYIHDPSVRVGRIQNFKNWSPEMVPDPAKTCLGLEYFCTIGDDLWKLTDDQLLDLAKQEVHALGLAKAWDVEDGTVVRMSKAYPVYDTGFRDKLAIIRAFLDQFTNLQVIGRNGMHKYNNQDHSMLTAMLAVKNILGAHHDLWQVNEEQHYHEEATEGTVELAEEIHNLATTQPSVPERL
jgi:protoporphyrinogen oxidase